MESRTWRKLAFSQIDTFAGALETFWSKQIRGFALSKGKATRHTQLAETCWVQMMTRWVFNSQPEGSSLSLCLPFNNKIPSNYLSSHLHAPSPDTTSCASERVTTEVTESRLPALILVHIIIHESLIHENVL